MNHLQIKNYPDLNNILRFLSIRATQKHSNNFVGGVLFNSGVQITSIRYLNPTVNILNVFELPLLKGI